MSEATRLVRVSTLLLAVAVFCLPFSDLEMSSPDFWGEMGRLGAGTITPSIYQWHDLLTALLNTLGFAFQGVTAGALVGFLLSLKYKSFLVRQFSAFIRAIHELFWALIFIQVAGLSPLTGLLAIAIPYAGTFAKVFGEIFEETDSAPASASGARGVSGFFYTVLPLAWKRMAEYTSYRFECGVRSSAVLGFVGLPTLGFHMESYFSQGQYSEAMGMLYVLFLLIGTLKIWLKRKLIPIYVITSFIWLPPIADTSWELVWRFLSEDIVPAPLIYGGSLLNWLKNLVIGQAIPGIGNTILLTQMSLALTGILTLILFPIRTKLFLGRSRVFGHGVLVVLRTTPEYLVAFLGVLILGPSMLPGVLALGIHNAGILAHLTGRFTDEQEFRADSPSGILLYFYEVLPRIYRQFLAFLFYRWEVIQRESAILGILGIPTLGFYIDSAFEELRLDRAVFLIVVTALLNMGVDVLARMIRRGKERAETTCMS